MPKRAGSQEDCGMRISDCGLMRAALFFIPHSAFRIPQFLRVCLSGEPRGARAGDEGRFGCERVVDKLALLKLVDGVGARGWTRRRGAACVVGALALRQKTHQTRLDEGPPAHILRLLLTPDELRRVRVRGEDFSQTPFGEWVELFEPDYADARVSRLPARS